MPTWGGVVTTALAITLAAILVGVLNFLLHQGTFHIGLG